MQGVGLPRIRRRFKYRAERDKPGGPQLLEVQLPDFTVVSEARDRHDKESMSHGQGVL